MLFIVRSFSFLLISVCCLCYMYVSITAYFYSFLLWHSHIQTHIVIAIWNIMIFIIGSVWLSTDNLAWKSPIRSVWFWYFEHKNWFQLFIFSSLYFGRTLFGQMGFLSFYLPTEKEENKSHSTTKHKKINLPSTNLTSVVRLDIFLRLSFSFIPSDGLLCLLLVFDAYMMSNARCLMPYAWCYHYCLNEYWNRLLSYARVCESKK